jgi:DNA replication protein DnaC
MEHISGQLPDAGKITSGSSVSKNEGNHPDNAQDSFDLYGETCRYCDRKLQAEWVEFPPALQRKYGKSGEWYFHPCTAECEKKKDQHEWEIMRREARVEILRERSGLSKRMKGYTFDNFNLSVNESAREACQMAVMYVDEWEENREEGRGLYFCGGVGAGKTHLAVAVMNKLMEEKRVPSLFVTVPEFLDNLREAYMIPGRDLDEWMDTVKNADLLVLDDLGSERPTEWVRERLFVIVNHRYREALPTIFTSNVGAEDLFTQLGERTTSRIVAMCGKSIRIESPDHRETSARGER